MSEIRYFCLRGSMKSGTNWLGSLLSSHRDISCVGEFHWHKVVAKFNQMVNSEPLFSDRAYQETVRTEFELAIKASMRAAAEPGATVIGDRTPHTIVPVTLRGVPYISIVRDGRDVLVSRAFHLFNFPNVHQLFRRIPQMAETLQRFQADQWYFQKHPEELLCHETMVRESMSWWRDQLKSDLESVQRFPKLKIKFVRYEDLHADTQAEREKLFEFLEVDPTKAAKLTGVLTPGFGEERPTEFLRKGSVGDWKNYFTDEVKQWVQEEANEMLLQYKYIDRLDW